MCIFSMPIAYSLLTSAPHSAVVSMTTRASDFILFFFFFQIRVDVYTWLFAKAFVCCLYISSEWVVYTSTPFINSTLVSFVFIKKNWKYLSSFVMRNCIAESRQLERDQTYCIFQILYMNIQMCIQPPQRIMIWPFYFWFQTYSINNDVCKSGSVL